MRIAIVSKLWEETSPNSKGGTGASVGNLVNGLVDQGHHVTLFATKNSKTRAQKLIWVKERSYKDDYSEIKEYQNISGAFDKKYKFDIIHCHVEHKSLFFGSITNTPVLHTIRYGEFFKDETKLLEYYQKQNFAANSKALTKRYGFLNFLGHVYNGLDIEKFTFNADPEDYLLFLGRISPQKNPDLAIKAAIKLNMPIILAGKMVDADKKWLGNFKKLLKNENVKYVGEVGFKEKIALLKNARCLLQPTDYKKYFEACSNVILESMACGTPVVAFDSGSNKELIKHGKTGFVVKNSEQMIKYIKQLDSIRRIDCRKRIETFFTVEKMTLGYEKIYKKLTRKK